jgi:hypothetical protein
MRYRKERLDVHHQAQVFYGRDSKKRPEMQRLRDYVNKKQGKEK